MTTVSEGLTTISEEGNVNHNANQINSLLIHANSPPIAAPPTLERGQPINIKVIPFSEKRNRKGTNRSTMCRGILCKEIVD